MQLGQRSRAGARAEEITVSEMLSVLKSSRVSEVVGIVGKLVGVGLFATLVYSYCNVLIEACVRSVH